MIEIFPSREVALSVLHFHIHWYGLLYLLSFVVAYYTLPRLAKYRDIHITSDDWASILSWAVVGVIVGGRLGYVFLYEPRYFFSSPLDIFAVWKGGMASHGGFAGVILFLSYALWQRNISIRKVADIAVIPAALGLALGRFGNFINLELYGTVTSVPWGMEFPGAEGLRHPLPLYSVMQNIVIAGVCYWYLLRKPAQYGRTFALFIMLYSVCRYLLEYIREQTHSSFEFAIFTFTRGQLYTVPLFIVGLILWWSWKDAQMSDDAS